MCEGPRCTVNWRTEWLSDLKGEIANEVLKRKMEFIEQWKTGTQIKFKYEEHKDEMLPMKFDLVKNLRMKIQTGNPKLQVLEGNHLEVYYPKGMDCYPHKNALEGKGVKCEVSGHVEGNVIRITPSTIFESKDKLDDLAKTIVETLSM